MGHVHVLRLMMPDSQQALFARGVGYVHVRLSGSYLSREGGNGLWGLEMGIISGLLWGSIPPFPTKHQTVVGWSM